ncbi:hypothetical protein CBOM_07889 [Ceraceosorus bombacis]|uniref:Uncharacterized protein n=1 Tax=Ceraceosorus bombacis TaxID=401625 RepID=A0A0P1BJG9_9BASI|nr:hypothetical protein CBOM_07889 [Ceraceosorus bombacis]
MRHRARVGSARNANSGQTWREWQISLTPLSSINSGAFPPSGAFCAADASSRVTRPLPFSKKDTAE